MTQSKAYKKLEKKWYDKLKKDGFDDIEDVNYNRDDYEYVALKKWHSSWFQRRWGAKEIESRREYYIAADEFLNTHAFKNEIEKEIWRLYAEGFSLREISKTFKQKRGYCHESIGKIIRPLIILMKNK